MLGTEGVNACCVEDDSGSDLGFGQAGLLRRCNDARQRLIDCRPTSDLGAGELHKADEIAIWRHLELDEVRPDVGQERLLPEAVDERGVVETASIQRPCGRRRNRA
jgi:hypothetical protein